MKFIILEDFIEKFLKESGIFPGLMTAQPNTTYAQLLKKFARALKEEAE